ncbi:unnamed protein product [Pylaiella littoralis]
METGQRALLGRYPSLPQQVNDMMAHLDVGGLVLDCCGSTRDAVCRLLTERAFVFRRTTSTEDYQRTHTSMPRAQILCRRTGREIIGPTGSSRALHTKMPSPP